jgi:hypothetical protein
MVLITGCFNFGKELDDISVSKVVASGNQITILSTEEEKLVGYYISKTDSVPSLEDESWQDTNTFEVNDSGKYYVWVKDEEDNVNMRVVFVNTEDETIPTIVGIEKDGNKYRVLATDNDLIIGYHYTKTQEAPSLYSPYWQDSNELLIEEKGTYYIWARDVAGYVSFPKTLVVEEDNASLPKIITATYTNSEIKIIGEDNGLDKEYFISRENTKPTLTDGNWSTNNVFTVDVAGLYYAWLKEDGKISAEKLVFVNLIDQQKPLVNRYELKDKTLSVFASDNDIVTGYYVSDTREVDFGSEIEWSKTNTFVLEEYKTYYLWAKDAAGNISTPFELILTEPDTKAPVIIGVDVIDKTIKVAAEDNVAIAGYYLSGSNIGPSLNSEDWMTLTEYTVKEYGIYYIFVKDTSNNVTIQEVKVLEPDNEAPQITNITNNSYDLAVTFKDDIKVAAYYITNKEVTLTKDSSEWTNSGLVYGDNGVASITLKQEVYGKYYIWVKDEWGNITSKEYTLSDNSAPKIQSITSKDKIISVVATDDTKGLLYHATQSTLQPDVNDTKIWQELPNITVTSYGKYYIWVKDTANNLTSGTHELLEVDSTAPIVKATVNDKTINISATDIGSGVAGYAISTTNVKPDASKFISTRSYKKDYGTYYVWAIDAAGIISKPVMVTTKDTIAPKAVIGQNKLNFTVTTTDNHSTSFTYTIFDAEFFKEVSKGALTTSAKTFTMSEYKEYVIIIKDEAGNAFEKTLNLSSTTIIEAIDKTPPTITSSIVDQSEVKLAGKDANDVTIATDLLFALTKGTKPSANATNTWYKSPLTVPSESTYYAWVKDKAGNVSSAMYPIVVSAPTDTQKPNVTDVVPTGLTVKVTATDNIAVTGFCVKPSGSSAPLKTDTCWIDYSKYQMDTVDWAGYYNVYAKDLAGNISYGYPIQLYDAQTTTNILPSHTAYVSLNKISVNIVNNGGSAIVGYKYNTEASSTTGTWLTTSTYNAPTYGFYYVYVKNADNEISSTYQRVYVAPVTIPTLTPPTIESFNIQNVVSTVNTKKVTIVAKGNGSPISYNVSTTSTIPTTGWTTSNTINVTTSGTHYIWTSYTEYVGDGFATSKQITLDNTSPVVLSPTISNLTITPKGSDDSSGLDYYIISNSFTSDGKPGSVSSGWLSVNIASYTVSSHGTYYIWLKDKAGNISKLQSFTTLVPTVTGVTVTNANTTTNAKTVKITSNINHMFLINQSTIKPLATDTKWQSSNTFTIKTSGAHYAWVKDYSGVISNYFKKDIDNTSPVALAPTISVRTLTPKATDSGVTMTSFQYLVSDTTDFIGDTFYTNWLNVSTTKTVLLSKYGTFYIWIKDAAGNISAPKSFTISDTVAPVIKDVSFSGPNITIGEVTEADTAALKYMLTKTTTKPSLTATTWQTSKAFTVGSPGTYYVWAKDLNNVSAYKAVTIVNTNIYID